MTATLSQSAQKRYQIFLEDGLEGVKPILFNTDMVQAVQAHTKTETRRKLKCPPPSTAYLHSVENGVIWSFGENSDKQTIKAPYKAGNILYVRETWTRGVDGNYLYKANREDANVIWRPSIHMPREAARIFLRVLSVHAERLQNITPEGVCSEGIRVDFAHPTQLWRSFIKLWDSTIKPIDLPIYGWEANPWVWVIRFEEICKEEAFSILQ